MRRPSTALLAGLGLLALAAAPGTARADGSDISAHHRLMATVFYSPGPNDASVWVGGFYGFAPVPKIFYFLVGGGYWAAGPSYGSGNNGPGIAVGAEFDLPLPGYQPFLRVLTGYQTPIPASDDPYEPLMVVGHAGVRLSFLELYLNLGLGPAKGLNAGIGTSINFF
jgi:hypothetical protein